MGMPKEKWSTREHVPLFGRFGLPLLVQTWLIFVPSLRIEPPSCIVGFGGVIFKLDTLAGTDLDSGDSIPSCFFQG